MWESIEAAKILYNEYKIKAMVINIHTIKPIDKNTLIDAAQKCNIMIVAEEHQKFGGLFSAVSEVCSEYYPVHIKSIAMNDRFGESGKADELMKYYGFTATNIVNNAIEMLNKYKK